MSNELKGMTKEQIEKFVSGIDFSDYRRGQESAVEDVKRLAETWQIQA